MSGIHPGTQAKIIKYRFDDKIIKKLLQLRWWYLSEKDLKQNISLFQKGNIELEDLDNLKMENFYEK